MATITSYRYAVRRRNRRLSVALGLMLGILGTAGGGVLAVTIWSGTASGYVFWTNAIVGIGFGVIAVGVVGVLIGMVVG
jgi:hypothetical protein